MTVTITVRGVLCSRDTLTRHSLVLLDSMQAFVTSWKGIKNDSGGEKMWGDMGHGKKNGREEQQWVTAGGV